MTYDDWKTRTPEDDAARDVHVRSPYPRIVWDACPQHGWTEYVDDGPRFGRTCQACHNARFDELVAFVTGPRPEEA